MISAERAREVAGQYYEDIYHFCYIRLGNEVDAHDVVQDVFLLFQQKGDGVEEKYIRAWLFSAADKKIKEKFRDIAKREKALIFGLSRSPAQSAELVYEMEQDFLISDEEIEKKKKSIISQLNEKELELFEMVYVRHMRYEELAKMLDISENAVKARVFRLKNKIKSKVSFAFMALLLLFMKL